LALSQLLPRQKTGFFPERWTQQRTGHLIRGLNQIWSTCQISFASTASIERVIETDELPYRPRTQEHLGQLAQRLHPHAFQLGRVPLTVAGNWTELEPQGGMKLHGLGWAFYSPRPEAPWRIDRIGAMVAAERLNDPGFIRLAAHEIGHALTLGHSEDPINVMAGGDQLKPEQCQQARQFVERALIPAGRPLLATTRNR
jgi:hypothetical protein